MNIYVSGQGAINPKLVILGEAPSYEEEVALKPFVGPAGKQLDSILKDASINRYDCWLTNVSKFAIPPSDKKIPFHVRCNQVGINLDEQLSELRNELNQIKPNCILALGSTALWALTGKHKISDYRGSILLGMGHKTVPTYHPAHLIHQQKSEIRSYWQRQVMIFDFHRAKIQSEFPEVKLPHRNLNVCRSSEQLHDFIARHQNASKLSIDIEAIKCIPICIGLAFSKDEGLSVPLWNDINFTKISEISNVELASIWIMLAKLLNNPKYRKIGQNFNYDQNKIEGLGFIIDELYSDTMLKAFTINPELPKNLGFNTSIYTEEPYYKDEGSEFNYSKQSIDDLLIYNARDACVTLEIDDAMEIDLTQLNLNDFYYNFVMKFHDLYRGIESIGFRISDSKRNELLEKYIEWDERLNYELFQLTQQTINVDSPKQVAKLLYQVLKIPERESTGEEVLTQVLSSLKNPNHRKIIELILEDKRVKKTINTYLLSPPDFDNRMRTSYFPCLETGRTSTHQLKSPIRPQIEFKDEYNHKKKKSIGMAFQTITKHGDIGSDVRTMFIPDDGEIFLQADSSQAEARVVALLANDEESLKLYDEHDIHALTASWFFGGSESDYSKKLLGFESPKRFAGKTLRHAGNLGAGKRRAAIELNTQARKYGIDFSITESQAGEALNVFHRNCPNIKSVFHTEVIKCLEKNRMLIAPVPFGINSKYGGKRTFFERYGEELFRQAFSYIPQRAVSDNTKAAALRIKSRITEIKILLESHDSLLFSIPIDKLNEFSMIIKEEFERPINFENCSLPRRNLIIPCEIEKGFDYKNLTKFKFDEVINGNNQYQHSIEKESRINV